MPDLGPRGALLSPCQRYRYLLWRDLSEPLFTDVGGKCLFVMLNPSKADHMIDDPTVTRCMRFAADFGHASLVVANLFALRSTDPDALLREADPVGPENDLTLRGIASEASRIICAWGAHRMVEGRVKDVLAILRADGRKVHHLGLTKDGHPRHPLYLKADVRPTLWE